MQAQKKERGLWVNTSPGIMDKLSSIKDRFRDWRNHVKKSLMFSQSRMLKYFRKKD